MGPFYTRNCFPSGNGLSNSLIICLRLPPLLRRGNLAGPSLQFRVASGQDTLTNKIGTVTSMASVAAVLSSEVAMGTFKVPRATFVVHGVPVGLSVGDYSISVVGVDEKKSDL